MPYYDDDQIDDIKTDMLYMKYITELVKPIKFNKQYGNEFDVYFQRYTHPMFFLKGAGQ